MGKNIKIPISVKTKIIHQICKAFNFSITQNKLLDVKLRLQRLTCVKKTFENVENHENDISENFKNKKRDFFLGLLELLSDLQLILAETHVIATHVN